MVQNEIELKVIDLFNGEILTGEQIPKLEGNLIEIIRQFSGQSYCISRFTGVKDYEGNKLFEYDYVEVYKFSNNQNLEEHETSIVKIGEGQIVFNYGAFSVTFLNEVNGELELYYLNDRKHDFKKIGDYFKKGE